MGSITVKKRLEYPEVRRDESVVDNYHGVLVHDPYRWMEDPDAKEVKDFVERQMALTESILQACETREKLKERITILFDHPKYGCPSKRSDKYFYLFNTGLQAQSALYVQDNLEANAEMLLNPNNLSEDGTVALNIYAVSENAKFLAVGLSTSGSDWVNIKVFRVANKTAEPDSLSWVKFSSITWTHDNKGFFYSRYPDPKGEGLDAGTETNINLDHQLFYHFLGTNQSKDILCWKDPKHPKWRVRSQITEDGKYVLLYIIEGCDPVNRLFYCDLAALPQGLEGFKGREEMLPFQKLIDNFEARYALVANDGALFTFRTNKNAPRYKLVRVDFMQPDVWSDVVRESKKDVLQSACCVNGSQLLLSYLSDVKYFLQIRDLQFGSLLHNLPIDIGSISEISGRRKDKEIFVDFTSFLTPGIIYGCNLDVQKPKFVVYRETVVPGFDRKEFEANQVFITSKDGTKIPMFIVSKKDIALDGSHPALLYGYGGFNGSLTPNFSVGRIVISKHLGAVFAIANIRGGGEYGEEWHKAGSLAKKQNCFDDFISVAEFLVSEGYTQPKKLCIEGVSNGGLLVAACMNQTMQYVLCKSVENSPQTKPIVGRIDTKSGHGAGTPTQKVIDEAADKYAFMAKVVGASWISNRGCGLIGKVVAAGSDIATDEQEITRQCHTL